MCNRSPIEIAVGQDDVGGDDRHIEQSLVLDLLGMRTDQSHELRALTGDGKNIARNDHHRGCRIDQGIASTQPMNEQSLARSLPFGGSDRKTRDQSVFGNPICPQFEPAPCGRHPLGSADDTQFTFEFQRLGGQVDPEQPGSDDTAEEDHA
ncbi:hypothetical protein D3C80_679850 [compost metagenome]